MSRADLTHAVNWTPACLQSPTAVERTILRGVDRPSYYAYDDDDNDPRADREPVPDSARRRSSSAVDVLIYVGHASDTASSRAVDVLYSKPLAI